MQSTHPQGRRLPVIAPVKGDSRYFVVTQWASDADFQLWADAGSKAAHGGNEGSRPVASGADLLEFEVVDLEALGD
jgi:heme-degrading monooxygenase HmoA